MANHKSSIKRIRSNEAKRLRNRYQLKTTRTQIKRLRATTSKSEAEELFQQVSSLIDKLAKKNIIHWKNAANKKSKLARFVNSLQPSMVSTEGLAPQSEEAKPKTTAKKPAKK